MRKEVIGNATLYLGDMLDILPTLPIFDLILTDPPYGLGIDGQKESINRNPKHNRKAHDFLKWDVETPPRYAFEMMFHKSKHQIIWGGNYFSAALPSGKKGWLFWDKGQRGLTMSDGEIAYTSLEISTRAIVINRVELLMDGTNHPTQKPVRLMSWCLSLAPQCVTVCDPYMGTGTIGVACMQAGRPFSGIEREESYFDIACERIENAQRQERLFA
jgi:site-specific DNA-methyltransferase (adenine-specific)